jgi:lipoate-protein ligase A
LGTTDVVQEYIKISKGLIEAAQILGVKANFNPGDPRNCPNITADGKKISGSAQFHKAGVVLQHGTFLLDINLEKMFTFLRVPWAKTIQDVVCVARDRLTSVGNELDRNVGISEAYDALIKGFEKSLEIELEEGVHTLYEERLASRLRKEKFATNEWNLTGKVKQINVLEGS